MASKMTGKETEKFIDTFEQKDCLWRMTSPEYSDRNVRLKAASEMNMMGQYLFLSSIWFWYWRGYTSAKGWYPRQL